MKWKLPDGDFMLSKKDKRFSDGISYVSFEILTESRSRYRLVKIEQASIFRKDSENLLLLQNRHTKKITRLMKKKMLIIVEVKKV